MSEETLRSDEGADRALDELAARLAAAISRAGGKRAVSERSGVPASSLDRYLRGRSEPPALTLAALADACGTSVDALTSGERSAEASAVDQVRSELASYVAVPQLSVRASAGQGRSVLPLEEDASSALMLRESWLRRLGIAPSKVELIMAEGDSMADTIKDGDLLLVDRSVERVRGDGIYVLITADLVQVKRVQILFDGSWRIISDNPLYAPGHIPVGEVDGVRVVGRIRWFGRAL